MKTELRQVTPLLAREWLRANVKNRPLRPGVVDGFHIAYGRGEWKETHQGIAFSKTGRLLDGQHRLTFISQLPEGTRVPINVTTDLDDKAFDAIDQGYRRTASDVLGVSADLASIGRLFARIASSTSSSGLSVQYVAPFVDWCTNEFEELISFCPGKSKIWSSAPVRSAAIYQMKRGMDPDFIKVAYHSLVMSDIDAMPNAARVLLQQYMSGKIVSARTLDLFCRAARAFDSRQSTKISKIIVRDQAAMIDDVRAYVLAEMKKSPAKAGQTVAKPGANSKVRRIA